MREERRP
ncbi:Protein of unknown function [Thermobacillus xylanilyticus]|nr:Protein of unknown function [Thermobacillus xylanilyticus]